MHIAQLPGTLLEAVEELEKDTFIQKVLGDHIAGKYIGKSGKSTVLRYPNGRFRSSCTSIKIFLSFVIME